jgi:hypothetical protein
MYQQLNYLENTRQSMMPETKIAIPTPMTTKPLTVQLGLLYIKEEGGPMMDLLCNVNVIPRMINMTPTINNDQCPKKNIPLCVLFLSNPSVQD